MPSQDVLKNWLSKQRPKRQKVEHKEIVVNPFEYPDNRMDDPNQPGQARKYNVRTQNRDPVTIIRTISARQFKKLTGEHPEGIGHIVRVMSPGLTTQPLISVDKVDIRQAGGPKIRVIEGGAGVPESQPFINPWTSTNPLSKSSLLAPGQADSKGFSVTKNYDELRRRMGNCTIRLNGEELDILLPIDVTEAYSGTPISIGGVPGIASIKSNETGFTNNEPIGTKRRVRTMSWDGQLDEEKRE